MVHPRTESNLLVEFFAPWCPACVSFLPHLEHIREQTQVEGNKEQRTDS
jgi:thiol-disulfide isomerase/thioredoxin